jgi:hypothetical protein
MVRSVARFCSSLIIQMSPPVRLSFKYAIVIRSQRKTGSHRHHSYEPVPLETVMKTVEETGCPKVGGERTTLFSSTWIARNHRTSPHRRFLKTYRPHTLRGGASALRHWTTDVKPPISGRTPYGIPLRKNLTKERTREATIAPYEGNGV